MDKKYLRPEADTIPELELWYKLDNFVSTAYVHDYSGNNRTSGCTFVEPSYPGFSFSGELNVYLPTTGSFQSIFRDSFSISSWAKGTSGTIFGTAVTGNVVKLYISSNTLSSRMDSNGFSTTAIEAIDSFPNANVYRHVVATFEANTQLRLYVNGVERALLASPNDGDATRLTFSQYSSSDLPYIGALDDDDFPADNFTGNIGDVRLYSKALSAVEVKNIYELTRWRYSV